MKPRIATIRLEPGHYGVCIQVPSEEFAELPNVHETIAKCPHSTNGTIPQDAQRLAACWNACHGLDLPPDIPAGAVANLIAAARDCRGFHSPTTGYYHVDPSAHEALRAALAPFAGQNLAPVSPEIPPDRRPVWSFEVDGQHVRWCGTLEQFHKDRVAYVDQSEGQWDVVGSTHYRFHDRTIGTRTTFRAVRA